MTDDIKERNDGTLHEHGGEVKPLQGAANVLISIVSPEFRREIKQLLI